MKFLTALTLALLAVTAAAQQGHLEVQTTVQKQQVYVDDEGKEQTRLVPAETVLPGETVFYTITFTNVSDETADHVVITNPIALELTYLEGSAFGPGMTLEFSVDGGGSFAAPDALSIVEDGETRAAGPSDYTHVRWVMQNDLAAGAQGTARFAAILE